MRETRESSSTTTTHTSDARLMCGHGLVLTVLGLVAFGSNLPSSLFGGAEGLYASVTETMMRTGEYWRLTLHGELYQNKPPLFFWLQALSAHVFGLNEFALRLPGALCSLGTVWATYAFGRTLFSPTAGFWAAMVVTTCYVSVWFGQMAIIDPILTCCMTLGLLGLVRAYLHEAPHWYLVGWVALAVGAMVKNFHAFVMPMALFLMWLAVLRDVRPLRSRFFWVGAALFASLMGVYYAVLGHEFVQHFFVQENIVRMTRLAGDEQGTAWEAYLGKRPIHWYAYAVWFDLFPWAVLFPPTAYLLWQHRPWRNAPRETLLVLWFAGYFLAFSLLPEKHERYLMPLAPGAAMWIGYFAHVLRTSGTLARRAESVTKVMLGVLSVIFAVLVFAAPYLLERKWNVPLDVLPLGYQLAMLCGAAGLLYLMAQQALWRAFVLVGVLAVGLMGGVVFLIVPGISAVASPKVVFSAVQSVLRSPSDPIQTFQHWNWRSDEDQFYWEFFHKKARIIGEGLADREALGQLAAEVNELGEVVLLMTQAQYDRIVRADSGLFVTVLKEFLRPKKNILLVSVAFAQTHSVSSIDQPGPDGT